MRVRPPSAPPLPRLCPDDAVARGSERAVFEWAEEPGLLIKLMHPHSLSRDFFGRVTDPVYLRERRGWLAAQRFAARTGRPPPVAEVLGRISAREGAAHVVRKVADARGRMGPTLERLVGESAFGAAELDLLNRFAADLVASGLVVYDAQPSNIVLETTVDGAARFVLVDGLGDRGYIPVRSWVPRLARRRLDRAFLRTARKTGLSWDVRAARFRFEGDGRA